MRSLILICVVCLQLGWSHGEPKGVGAVAYQDTTGRRYGGTYDLDDAQVYQLAGGYMPYFGPQPYQNVDDFFPEYFSNLENLLKETFETNFENQQLAFTAAKKAYDLTSNQAGYIPNFPTRFNNRGGFADFPGFGFGGHNMDNRAFASGVVGPSFSHQIAAISPSNPNQGNVDVVNRFSDAGNKPGFYSVQTSSFSSSSDIGGKKSNHRRAQTIVNKDGKITAYKVEN